MLPRTKIPKLGPIGLYSTEKERRPFLTTTKKIEWMKAGGHDPYEYIANRKFVKTSKCRKCPRKLTWGDGTYEFDHKNNRKWDNSQKNCYLVCRSCHGKATRFGTRKVRAPITGITIGHKKVKKKVWYKKERKRKKRKRRKSRPYNPFELSRPMRF